MKSAKAQLQNRFGASVAEVDHHEKWQRARLTIACAAREHGEAERLLEEAVRYLERPGVRARLGGETDRGDR